MKIPYKLLALAGIGVACQPPAEGPKEKPQEHKQPNIIFIMSDDHAYQAISAYGGILEKSAPTPNIDEIAKNGMRFDRCLVTNSISGPSRACILTGKYSHMNGFVANEATPFDSSQQTFPKLLQKAGYETAVVGKWHLDSQPTGFSYYDILTSQGAYYHPDFINEKGKHQDSGYVTELITKKSLEFLAKAKNSGKPFMLMVHHKAPHRNWVPGPNELTQYANTVFPEPEGLFDDYSGRGKAEHEQAMTIANSMSLEEDLKMWHDIHTRMNPKELAAWNAVYDPIIAKFKKSNLKGKALTQWKYQRYLHDYLSCVAGVDKSVGEIRQYLKDNGLDQNTIVVYTSDQGFYLGEHGWFDKRFMFEESYRTPLLIEWPNNIKAGSVNKDMVSNIDFAETFLDIAGAKIPDDMQGASMLPILKGTTPADWRDEHYYHYYEYPGYHSVKRHYGISTQRYKLIHFYYDIDEWEMFDLKSDPKELRNVYNNPAYKTVRDEMHMRLKKIMFKYKDSDAKADSILKLKLIPKTYVH